MLMPVAQEISIAPRMLAGLIPTSNPQQRFVTSLVGIQGREHTALPGSAALPPGPASSTTDLPKVA